MTKENFLEKAKGMVTDAKHQLETISRKEGPFWRARATMLVNNIEWLETGISLIENRTQRKNK
tara:strand:+ start:713 stop:901 length:189 start_codon:yes stop_codon:yes gene_type:complete